ncbi:MAG: alpha/beta hydrolase, partial [Proteobacteria bacterium]|nr:alpha/beta hydrolase [Pseudomonadota bacterium]
PPKMSRQLFALANQPKTLKALADTGHNDLSSNGGIKAVLEFLGKL